MVRGASTVVGASCLVLLSVAIASARPDRPDQQASTEPSAVSRGLAVYEARKCSTCHMIAGKGNIRFPLDGIARTLPEADLRRWLTDTVEMEGALAKQPAVRMSEWLDSNRKINDADLSALVAYLLTLK